MRKMGVSAKSGFAYFSARSASLLLSLSLLHLFARLGGRSCCRFCHQFPLFCRSFAGLSRVPGFGHRGGDVLGRAAAAGSIVRERIFPWRRNR